MKRFVPGDRVAGFEIVDVLAEGPTSVVYRARPTVGEGKSVALKLVSLAGAEDHARVRFRREAQIACTIEHRNLVRGLGFGEDPASDFGWLVLELVDGPSLTSTLSRDTDHGPPDHLEQRTFVEWIAGVARALGVLHGRGLVHRDVKPSNIVLALDAPDQPTRAILVDLGLARPQESSSTLSTLRFSYPYAAPEQILNRAVDARADVFSLGIVLHDLMAGRRAEERPVPPFHGLEPLHQLVPWIDRPLAAIVARASDPLPRWRYANGDELAEDLERWLRGAPPLAGRSLLDSAHHWIDSRPRAALVASVALTGALAAIVGLQLFAAYHATPAPDLAQATTRSVDPDLHDAAVRIAVDGWHARPSDVAVFAAAVSRSSVPITTEVLLDLLGRLAYEKPAESIEDQVAVAGLLGQVRALLEPRGASDRLILQLDAWTVVGHLGGSEDVAPLVEWFGGRIDEPDEKAMVDACFGLALLAEIVRRARCCGEAASVVAQVSLRASKLAEIAAGIERRATAVDHPGAEWMDALLSQLAWAERDGSAAAIPWDAFGSWGKRPTPSAVRRRPDAAARIAAAAEDPTPGSDATRFVQIGACVEALGDEVLYARVNAALEAEVLRNLAFPHVLRESFRAGIEDMVAVRNARRGPLEPDPESLLSVRVGPDPAKATFPRRRLDRGPDGPYAGWDFGPWEAIAGAGSLSLYGAPIYTDEYSGGNHIRLEPVEGSRLVLSYELPADLPPLDLRIEFQRSLRRALPRGGTAGLVVFLDGQRFFEQSRVPSGPTDSVQVSSDLERIAQPRYGQIEITLTPWSNTSVRISSVALESPQP